MARRNTLSESDARQLMENYLFNLFNIEREHLKILTNAFRLRAYDKKKVIITETQNSESVFFIIKGLIRIYYNKSDKEITTWFLSENDFFMSAYHVFTKNDNYSNYETLEETIVLESTYEEMEYIYSKYSILEHLGRKLVEAYYSRFMIDTYNVMFLSAEERYEIFLKEYSSIFERVSLKHIASYLGISQETLSRIRAKVGK